MPDVLVTMFTANYQSVLGVRDVIQSARAARQRLAYDRMALTVLPLPSRFPRGGDSPLLNEWLDRIATELGSCIADWLPRGIEPRAVFQRLAIPHRDEFALGERLAVAEQKTAGAEALTAVYDRIAGLLAAEFRDIETALRPIEPAPVSRSAARVLESLSVSGSVVRALYDPTSGHGAAVIDRFDVFVSYPRAGSVLFDWIYQFVAALDKASAAQLKQPLRFILDIQDRTDADFNRHRPVLDRSRVLLAILTPHYLASSWCLAEWQAFEDREQAEGRALIVPIALRGVSELPGRFSERVAIDGTSVDFSDTNDAAMAVLVEQATTEVVTTLEGRPLPVGASDPQPKTDPAHRSVEFAGQRHRLLFLAANPLSAGLLALTVEARAIEDVLDRSQFREQLELHSRWVVRPRALLRTLQNVRPAVLHFSGQGASDGLYLEGPDRLLQLVSAKTLAEAVRAAGSGLRLVVLYG